MILPLLFTSLSLAAPEPQKLVEDNFEGLSIRNSFSYQSTEENNIANDGTLLGSRFREIYFSDLEMGYLFHNGFYFGLLYAAEVQNINKGGPKAERNSLGFSLGYSWGNFLAVGTWIAYSTQKLGGAVDVAEYNNGQGFQIGMSYYWHLNSFLSLGPQVTYKNISYGEADTVNSNLDLSVSAEHVTVIPMLSILISLHRE